MTHRIALFALAAAPLAAAPAQALRFDFTELNGPLAPEVVQGFEAAGQLWSDLFSDDITVRLNIGFEQLPQDVLAQAGSPALAVPLANFQDILAADATNADDAQAAASVAALGGTLEFRTGGLGSTAFGTPRPGFVLDANGNTSNTTVNVNVANTRALGILAPDFPVSDGTITFSSDFDFDFDRSDGIDAGAFDFIGIAAHEIGHALGFTSGGDIADLSTPAAQDNVTSLTPLDLFRFSEDSLALDGSDGLDISTITDLDRLPFFSIDGGLSALAEFETGAANGTGFQSSHFLDEQGFGLLDPTITTGTINNISGLDTLAFDVIGFDLVPEPGSALALAGGLALLARRRRV